MVLVWRHFMDKDSRIKEIKKEIENLPKGSLTYKHINGKDQPYLQWSEGGKCHSYYIKLDERTQVLFELDTRKRLEDELRYLEKYSVKVARILSEHPTLKGNPIIGSDRFEDFAKEGCMYVDKTHFIKEWWDGGVKSSVITRPRRFGKSLMLSTIEHFFSVEYAKDLAQFEKLNIMRYPHYREIAGTYPVFHLTMAPFKTGYVDDLVSGIGRQLCGIFEKYEKLIPLDKMEEKIGVKYKKYCYSFLKWDEDSLLDAFTFASKILCETFGNKPIILIDEYDTPIQEAYLKGNLDEMSDFYRSFLNTIIKTNSCFERALLTGVTCVAKESFFSDANNVVSYTVFSNKYADAFGFTEEELFDILDCHDISEKEKIKEMYDGFTFGNRGNIYNPWSIINYMQDRNLRPYWVNSGGIGLASKLFLNADKYIKEDLMCLLKGGSIHKTIEEAVTFRTLDVDGNAIWTLLLNSGYLTASNISYDYDLIECDLKVTNRETLSAYRKIVNEWMLPVSHEKNQFIKALMLNDVDGMTDYMNEIALKIMSNFDVGTTPSERTPERFYHGFVLGMMVDLEDKYLIESNKESGYGRYDIMLFPKAPSLDGIIIEFKVFDPRKESDLEATADSALLQIKEKRYDQQLIDRGIDANKIRKYAFAFEGKRVLIKL